MASRREIEKVSEWERESFLLRCHPEVQTSGIRSLCRQERHFPFRFQFFFFQVFFSPSEGGVSLCGANFRLSDHRAHLCAAEPAARKNKSLNPTSWEWDGESRHGRGDLTRRSEISPHPDMPAPKTSSTFHHFLFIQRQFDSTPPTATTQVDLKKGF